VSAIFSECSMYRWRLDSDELAPTGLVFCFSGVNPSKAGRIVDGVEITDQTKNKWAGFTVRNGGRKFIAVNPFGGIATDVRELGRMDDPVGRDNDKHIREAFAEADVMVPCWGNSSKVPKMWRWRLTRMLEMMLETGKPILTFGLTKSGDPMHPLMLGYNTPLIPWSKP
jgi:hypothetical protein